LSEGKLAQLLPALRSRPLPRKVNVTTPVGGFEVDMATEAEKSKFKRFELVVGQIQRSAGWFTDPELRPGQWAEFVAPLNYLLLPDSRFGGMLLFVDHPEASTEYPTGGAIRLILHGSPRNLVAAYSADPVVAERVPEKARLSPSAANEFMRILTSSDPISPNFRGNHRPTGLSEYSQRFVRELDRLALPETAAWMTGMVRITAQVKDQAATQDGKSRLRHVESMRYIYASPLYIEYSDDAGYDAGY